MNSIDKVATNHSIETINPEFDLTSCKTPEDVNAVLSQMALEANKSVAYALKAQIQVVKYISSPELYGSAFDLFFKNLHNAIKTATEDEEIDIKEQAGLMLNNLIFFMYAKIKWEVDVNRSEGEKLLLEASRNLSESIVNLAKMYYSGAASIVVKAEAVQNLGKVFFAPDKSGDSWFEKAGRWLFKSSLTKEKNKEFYDSLDLLAQKLETNYNIIGKNNLIAGIYENYYNGLIEHHSEEWEKYQNKAAEYKEKSWKIPCYILGIGTTAGAAVWFIRLIVRWIKSWFVEMSSGWAQTQWMWTGIILFGLSAIISIICIIVWRINDKKANGKYSAYCNYYNGIMEMFKE